MGPLSLFFFGFCFDILRLFVLFPKKGGVFLCRLCMAFISVCVSLRLKAELVRLQSDPLRLGPSHGEIKVLDRIVELSHREEVMWQQRSRVQWLQAGDKNTKFFHMRASQRKKKNRVERLRKPNGTTTDNAHEMGVMTT